MKTPKQLAKHLREVYFGGNWTAVNIKDTLADVTFKEATTQIDSTNTIETLVYHLHYYVTLDLRVLEGGPLVGSDKESFIHDSVTSQKEWEDFLEVRYIEAKKFVKSIESLSEETLWKDFVAEKHGNYYRNLAGIIEHTHYHLGQIVLLKKLIRNGN
ncbi:DUF1572 domain-containing protein [Patiriisocius hiemis]|uniref:DUF1572 domain-containing protein n=1 Tax=Patiriisocius hiemis TaxID=3075604 RepID=A0ABU2YAH6_9FLAO|nr:DUF1572 domain-containing protein [Constantimarinum sp. W242]MDT0555012.1 DUF1572 domain-containing protein [Constantimarinum sp. W242]